MEPRIWRRSLHLAETIIAYTMIQHLEPASLPMSIKTHEMVRHAQHKDLGRQKGRRKQEIILRFDEWYMFENKKRSRYPQVVLLNNEPMAPPTSRSMTIMIPMREEHERETLRYQEKGKGGRVRKCGEEYLKPSERQTSTIRQVY